MICALFVHLMGADGVWELKVGMSKVEKSRSDGFSF